MNSMFDQAATKARRIRIVTAAVFALLIWVFAAVTRAAPQKIAPLTAPDSITPPAGNAPFLVGHAIGTQGYVCLPASNGAASWTVNAARPEATLFENLSGKNLQIVTHFLSPLTSPNELAPQPLPFANATWQSSIDGSKVWARPVHAVSAGADASCPNHGSIDCLLLQSIGSEKGPSGGSILTGATFVQRLKTQGGTAPGAGCSAASDVGKQALVPYTADYYFFRGKE